MAVRPWATTTLAAGWMSMVTTLMIILLAMLLGYCQEAPKALRKKVKKFDNFYLFNFLIIKLKVSKDLLILNLVNFSLSDKLGLHANLSRHYSGLF